VPLASLIPGTMEFLENKYTKSPIDFIGDCFTVLIMLPVALIIAVLVGIYFGLKFPIWWLQWKWRNYKRSPINRDNKNFLF